MQLKKVFFILVAFAVFAGALMLPVTAQAKSDAPYIRQVERVYTMQSDGSALVSQVFEVEFATPSDAVQLFISGFLFSCLRISFTQR